MKQLNDFTERLNEITEIVIQESFVVILPNNTLNLTVRSNV